MDFFLSRGMTSLSTGVFSLYLVNDMRVRFIGSGNAFNDGNRLNQGIIIETGEDHHPSVMLDCGPCVPANLRRIYGDSTVNYISHVLFTHFHGDHTAGFPFFWLNSKYMGNRRGKLLVAGPAGIEAHVRGLNSLCYPSILDEPGFEVSYVELEPDTSVTLANGLDLAVESIPVKHRPESLGYRVTLEGKTVAITGDTSWTDRIVDLARGADLLIAECNDHAVTGVHLSYEELVEKAELLESRKIILTHLGSGMIKKLGEVTLDTASDGLVIEI